MNIYTYFKFSNWFLIIIFNESLLSLKLLLNCDGNFNGIVIFLKFLFSKLLLLLLLLYRFIV